MNRLESSGVVLIGIGCIGGAVAASQDVPVAVVTSVFTVSSASRWRYGEEPDDEHRSRVSTPTGRLDEFEGSRGK
jgi:hypothetical protein